MCVLVQINWPEGSPLRHGEAGRGKGYVMKRRDPRGSVGALCRGDTGLYVSGGAMSVQYASVELPRAEHIHPFLVWV